MYCRAGLFCRPTGTDELAGARAAAGAGAEEAGAAWLEPRMIIGFAGALCRELGRVNWLALGVGCERVAIVGAGCGFDQVEAGADTGLGLQVALGAARALGDETVAGPVAGERF